jgi:hypothetical protein
MKALLLSVSMCLSALVLGCGEDDGGDPPSSDQASGGKAANTSGGTGGMDSGSPGAGEGGASGAAESDPDARREHCEAVCKTEAELPCAMDTAACVAGWCIDPVAFPPECRAVYDTMLECFAHEPVDSFECQGDTPVPKEGTCGGEQATLVACGQG